VIGSPLALVDADYAAKAWIKFGDIPALQKPNVRFIHGSLQKVDCEKKAATVVEYLTKESRVESYDFLVAASGLRRVWPVVPQALMRKAYLIEVEEQIRRVADASDGVAVVGGGSIPLSRRLLT
jgi:NADH dehydrogenase FAD-containing subunit